MRKLFKGGKYSREETIVFLLFILYKETWIMVAAIFVLFAEIVTAKHFLTLFSCLFLIISRYMYDHCSWSTYGMIFIMKQATGQVVNSEDRRILWSIFISVFSSLHWLYLHESCLCVGLTVEVYKRDMMAYIYWENNQILLQKYFQPVVRIVESYCLLSTYLVCIRK